MNVNKKNILDNHKTAIHYAILQKKWDVVRKLMNIGANVSLKDKSGQSAIDLICLSDSLSDMDLFRDILNKFEGNATTSKDKDGATMLHLICKNGSTNLSLLRRLKYFVDKFCENGTFGSMVDNDGCTPFHRLVAATNEVEAIEYFFKHCDVQDIDCTDDRRRTPLIHAVAESQNNPSTIRYLLSNG